VTPFTDWVLMAMAAECTAVRGGIGMAKTTAEIKV
jgi:hypothetical protein